MKAVARNAWNHILKNKSSFSGIGNP